MSIAWEEPPADGRGQHERIAPWPEIADALKARPGEWARVTEGQKATTARTLAYRINTGKFVSFRPAGAFEAVSRKQGDGTFVYARYVGEDAS
jgi:hypothetical protein